MYKTQVTGVLLLTALLVLGACAPTQIATEDEVAELQSQITALEEELSAKEAAIEDEVAELQSRITALEKELSEKGVTISILQQEIQQKQSEIEELLSLVPSEETTPPPTHPTEPPILPVITDDTWTLSGNLYLLTSQGTGSSWTYWQAMDINGGSLGGSIDYIYQKISLYWNSIRQSNTLILFNATSENLSVLGSWPEQYEEVCPFTVEELNRINLPFALLKRQDNGTIRAIVIANSQSEILQFVVIMKNKQVPVNIPWTLSNEIVASQTGGGWYEEPKVISDANISVQYPEGYETDASNMLAWANQVVTELQKWFPDFLNVIGSRIIIEIKDTGDPSHASADIGRTSIKFVAPSMAAKASSYYDTDWYMGNIAHELGHIFLDRYRNLAGGYLRSDLPRWFDEGFGEYLRLLVIGEQRFNENYSRYSSEIPNIIANGTSGISDVYAGGAWVLRFMDSKFGIDTIKAIIASEQPTFWAAVTEQTSLTIAQFDEQLKEWLDGRAT